MRWGALVLFINTDKVPAYAAAICPPEIGHRQVKYLNNIVEADHGKLKRLIKPTLGFKSMKTAYATIKEFEVMRMFKKGRFDIWKYGQGIQGEIRIITELRGELIVFYLLSEKAGCK